MTLKPKYALDDPRSANLDPSIWVVAYWNKVRWPSGSREVSYLSWAKDRLRGYSLFTGFPEGAATFQTEEEARAFIAENNKLRPFNYGPDTKPITIGDLIRLVGFQEIER